MTKPTARDMIELPGPFSFKVFVRPEKLDEDGFLALAERFLGREVVCYDLEARASGKGNYVCYTLRMHIDVYEEIEGLYAGFREHEAVVYVL